MDEGWLSSHGGRCSNLIGARSASHVIVAINAGSGHPFTLLTRILDLRQYQRLAGIGDSLKSKLSAVGRIAAPKRLTIKEHFESWFQAKRSAGLKPASLRAWGLSATSIIRLFGENRWSISLMLMASRFGTT
jgi:hypothetical protein